MRLLPVFNLTEQRDTRAAVWIREDEQQGFAMSEQLIERRRAAFVGSELKRRRWRVEGQSLRRRWRFVGCGLLPLRGVDHPGNGSHERDSGDQPFRLAELRERIR